MCICCMHGPCHGNQGLTVVRRVLYHWVTAQSCKLLLLLNAYLYMDGGAGCSGCNVELVLSICLDVASVNGAEVVRLCQTCFTHLVSLQMSLNIWPGDEQLDLFTCFCILSTVTSQDLQLLGNVTIWRDTRRRKTNIVLRKNNLDS